MSLARERGELSEKVVFFLKAGQAGLDASAEN
jgi:hypothetical protein